MKLDRSNMGDNYPWYLRLIWVLFIAFLQVGLFYVTYMIYAAIPYEKFVGVALPLDSKIPYLKWTWYIYFFGFVYIFLWGAAGVWSIPKNALLKTIRIYSVLVLIGGIMHILIPTRAPWPPLNEITVIQRNFKHYCSTQPLACFPSMHVALAVLVAYISYYTFKSPVNRFISIILSILVSISVLTAKEHWISDALVGLLMGSVACWFWRLKVHRNL